MAFLGVLTGLCLQNVVNVPKVYEPRTNPAIKGNKGGCVVWLPGPLRRPSGRGCVVLEINQYS